MATLAEIRQQYPQYADLSDQKLAEGLHRKHYSDMPFDQFAVKIGLKKKVLSLDRMEDGSLVPTEDVYWASSGPVHKSSGIAQREMKYGRTHGFDFSIKPENVQDVRKGVSPIIRGSLKGISSIPGLAADAGVGVRNLLAGENTPAPTALFEQSLDRAFPMPNTPGDKTLEFMTGVLTGAKLPTTPGVANPAPKDFIKPANDLVRQQTLQAGQKMGLVVPPSTTNPSMVNRFLESLGGKIATAQDAAARNMQRFTSAGKGALGLSDDAPLTQEAIQALRKEAGSAYENLRGAGQIVADSKYADDLAAVMQKYRGAAKDFPELAKSKVEDLVSGVSKKEFSSDSAVDLLSILRDNTDEAFRTGNAGLGRATKDVTKAIENLIQRNMEAAGKTDLVQKFKDARQLIAKSHTVEDAFNPATGNVVGVKLANALRSGAPLSGELKTAGRFAQAFPKASNAIDDSGSVRNTDVILGAGASAVSKEPQWLLYPFVRQATRSFLLSNPGQKLATPGQGMQPDPETVLRALIAAEQARLAAQ
jgi:hypothetical protein